MKQKQLDMSDILYDYQLKTIANLRMDSNSNGLFAGKLSIARNSKFSSCFIYLVVKTLNGWQTYNVQ